jgi:hypothetical protein
MAKKSKPPADEQGPPTVDRQAHDAEWLARMDSYFLNDRTKPAVPPVRPEILKEIQDKAAEKAACEQAELARDALAKKVADEHVSFDDAVAAEAKRLHRKLSISKEFARDVTRGLKKQGIIAGRSKTLAAVKRLKIK